MGIFPCLVLQRYILFSNIQYFYKEYSFLSIKFPAFRYFCTAAIMP